MSAPMNVLAVTPVLVPLATVVATTLASRRPSLQQAFSFAGALAFLACAAVLVALAAGDRTVQTAFGGWAAPFGIEFILDRVGAVVPGRPQHRDLDCARSHIESGADEGVGHCSQGRH